MKKFFANIVLFFLIANYSGAFSQNVVVSNARFHAVLGTPLEVYPESTDGFLGSIAPGNTKDLSGIPIEQRSVVFNINGVPGKSFNAGGIVNEISETLILSKITWEYFDFTSSTWIRFNISDNGDFESSFQDFTFNEQGMIKLRVYPERLEATESDNNQSETELDIYFDVTLSCFYTEI